MTQVKKCQIFIIFSRQFVDTWRLEWLFEYLLCDCVNFHVWARYKIWYMGNEIIIAVSEVKKVEENWKFSYCGLQVLDLLTFIHEKVTFQTIGGSYDLWVPLCSNSKQVFKNYCFCFCYCWLLTASSHHEYTALITYCFISIDFSFQLVSWIRSY